MRVDPELSALRADPQPLRAAQASLERARGRWLADLADGELAQQMARYAAGEPLDALPGLARLVTSVEAASAATGSLIDALLPALRTGRFGLVPLRHQSTRHHCVIELARSGHAALTLIAYWRRADCAPETVCFAPGERHELCLRGAGTAEIVARSGGIAAPARLTRHPVTLGPGWMAQFDNAAKTKLVGRVDAPLVMLRLSRDALGRDALGRDSTQAAPAREYRLCDGALVHQAAADRQDSRREIALAVLGSMGRRDALPAILAAARSGPEHVRWEAIRQALTMDSAAGLALLSAVAADSADPLSQPAARLRQSLLERHPNLRMAQEPALCPA